MITVANTKALVPEFPHWFMYGKMRAGKTRAAATFPVPFFIVPFQEGSHVSLMGKDIDYALVHRDTGESIKVSGEPGVAYSMDAVLSFLEGKHAEAQKHWRKGTDEGNAAGDAVFPWQTVVIESITHYTDLLQEALTRGNTLDMDQTKWGKLGAHLRNVHTRLKSLPVHVVFIALSVEYHDQKGTLTGGGPAFPGAMKYKLPSACDCVVYMEAIPGSKGSARYIAHFQRHSVFEAGARFPKLTASGQMSPFSFAEVQKIIG